MKICQKCVLPETQDIKLDADGVCNLCKKNHLASKQVLLETEFVKKLNKQKGKEKYDCLVMCSGGKDSTAALYFMKERYKLNPLAFTFDHGFEDGAALDNVKRATDVLGIDFVYYKSSFMHEVFKKIIETKSKAVICHLCSIWYMQTSFEMAARYKTPFIVAGWTKGQLAQSGDEVEDYAREFMSMGQATKDFIQAHLKNDPKYKNFPSSMEEVLKQAKKITKAEVISPHWFLPQRTEEYTSILSEKLKWKPTPHSYPKGSTNCSLNFLASKLSQENFGYTHYHVEMSKLIREGLMTRAEALERLEMNFSQEDIEGIKSKLGIKS